ncbi:MAG: DNA primase [Deltaproteobacteria bacterium]|nr:DNA primase [Deltaproteobacteria bacterium]
MAFFSEADLDKVRAASDIVQIIGEKIPLKRAGRNFRGLCPFHSEKTPSFMVSAEKQIFHCFGCHMGGNVFSFLGKYEGLPFPEIVEKLAERFGIALESRPEEKGEHLERKKQKELLLRINRLAARFFFESLQDQKRGADARAYLDQRSTRPEMVREFLLGYAPREGRELTHFLESKKVPLEKAESLGLVRKGNDGYYDFFRNRLIFSVVSPDGKILGFSGRTLDPEGGPKYLNSSESALYNKRESFLGLNLAKNAIREKDEVILVEGNFDLLRLHQEGLRNVVAPLGTALTEQQIKILCRYTSRFILFFDGDLAGEKARRRGLELLLPQAVFPRAVLLPAGSDPDSFLLSQGVEKMTKMIQEAPPLLDLEIEKILGYSGRLKKAPGEMAREVSFLLSLIKGDVEKSLYIQKVAEKTTLPPLLVEKEVSRSLASGQRRVEKGSNFSPVTGEENRDRVETPPVERALVELLISGRIAPASLLQQVKGEDFMSRPLAELWELFREDLEGHGGLDVSRILSQNSSPAIQALLSELAVGAEKWEELEEEAGLECVKRFQKIRLQELLKEISHEVQEAQRLNDTVRIQALLERKNTLLRETGTRH